MTASDVNLHVTVETITSSLLRGAQANNAESWEQLVRVYAPLIYSWCRRKDLQPQDAHDVVQDVLVSVSLALKDFRRDQQGQSFRGWLRRITFNKLVDFWRRRGHRDEQLYGDANDLGLTDQGAANDQCSEETQLLFAQITAWIQGKFAEHNWQAFVRVVINNEHRKSVAEDLDLTKNQVDLACSRIMRRIREEFGAVDRVSE